jgi:hypothetical protein
MRGGNADIKPTRMATANQRGARVVKLNEEALRGSFWTLHHSTP